jgi:hypothetical protein
MSVLPGSDVMMQECLMLLSNTPCSITPVRFDIIELKPDICVYVRRGIRLRLAMSVSHKSDAARARIFIP